MQPADARLAESTGRGLVGCTADGLLVTRFRTDRADRAVRYATLSADHGALVERPVAAPPGKDVLVTGVDAGGTPLALDERDQEAFALRGGTWTWTSLGTSSPGLGARAEVLLGDRLDWIDNEADRVGTVRESS